MRKITIGLMMMGMLVLAACGQEETAEEVYQQAMEANEGIESAEMNMAMSQLIESDSLPSGIGMEMDTKSAVTMEPLTMHQTGTMKMEMEGFPIETDIEMYITENEFYMYEGMSQNWMKSGIDMMPGKLANIDQGPQYQLEMLESFIDDVEFTEEGDRYIFQYEGDGAELLELTQELMRDTLDDSAFAEMGPELDEMLAGMTVNSLFYSITLDKDTYHATNVTMNMDMVMDVEGETLNMKQDMTADYGGINTLDPIEVPQEVIDAAQEM